MKISALDKTWDWMKNLSPAAKIATSLIAKDMVGCVMYTSTARANKSYTPEKRADVANYDLANGVINIGMQLLLVKPIEYFTEKLVDKKLMKKFFKNLDERLGSKNNTLLKQVLKDKEKLVKGSTALISVILCQYIIKRFIAPYISMPASDKSRELGIIKPKLYPGETYVKRGKKADASEPPAQKLDVTSFEGDTNLIRRYQKSMAKTEA